MRRAGSGSKPKNLRLPPFAEALPAPIFFRAAEMPADATYPTHRHAWGEFVYSFWGVMELRLADRHYLAPPQYGIWLPPDVEHTGLNRRAAVHCSLYVAKELCGELPKEPCALAVSPLVRALLDHFRSHPPVPPILEKQGRLLQALVDRLTEATCVGSYLPTSDDPLLLPLLGALQARPGDERTLSEFAAAVGSTERTLARRFQSRLGMSFQEWRQRLRVVKAMPMLESGATVEAVALELGYTTSSAFIAMFRRSTGMTPGEAHRRDGNALDP